VDWASGGKLLAAKSLDLLVTEASSMIREQNDPSGPRPDFSPAKSYANLKLVSCRLWHILTIGADKKITVRLRG
jgi:hypothetical protein